MSISRDLQTIGELREEIKDLARRLAKACDRNIELRDERNRWRDKAERHAFEVQVLERKVFELSVPAIPDIVAGEARIAELERDLVATKGTAQFRLEMVQNQSKELKELREENEKLLAQRDFQKRLAMDYGNRLDTLRNVLQVKP